MGNILVCDDERSICEMLDIALRRDGHKVETVKSGDDAKKKLDSALYDVVVTDIKMPNTDGIEVLRYAHQVSPDSAVILDYRRRRLRGCGSSGESRRSHRLHPQVTRAGGRNQARHQSGAREDDAQPPEFRIQARCRDSKFSGQHRGRQPGDGEAEGRRSGPWRPPRARF